MSDDTERLDLQRVDGVPLPSAADAMREAVERAQMGELDGAAVWTAIAAELRAGTVAVEWRAPLPVTAAEKERIRMAPPVLMVDEILGYCRGQQAPPSGDVVRHARARRRAMEASDRPYLVAERTLIDEILRRADGDTREIEPPSAADCPYCEVGSKPCPWKHVRPAVAELPEDDGSRTAGGCNNCILTLQWIEGMGWTHDVPGHVLACPMDIAYRR